MDESAKSITEKSFVEALGTYLSRQNPTSALLLEGDWGSGKTYLINKFGESIATKHGKSLVLISVAGLQTRDQLADALFFAANSFLGTGYAKAFGVFARAAARWVKIEPEEVKPKADFKQGTVAVAIDDFERFAGDVQVLFGFIIELIDVIKVHVVIVASHKQSLTSRKRDEEAIVDAWSEKIVGKTVRVGWEPRFVVNYCLGALSNRFAADELGKHVDMIEALVRASEVRNFRLVQQAIREIADVIATMGDRFSAIEARADVLIAGLFVGQLELRRKWLSREHVSKLLATPDMGFHLGLKASAAGRSGSASGSGGSSDLEGSFSEFAREIADRYAGSPFILFPGGATFSRYIDEGLVETDEIVGAFQALLSRTESGLGSRSVISLGLDEFTGTEFSEQVRALLERLDAGEMTHLGEIGRVWLAGRHWVERRVVPFEIEYLKQRCLQAIGALPPNRVADSKLDIDSIFHWAKNDENDNVVREALLTKKNEASDSEKSERTAYVRNRLKLGLLTNDDVREPWLCESLFIDEAPLWIEAINAAHPRNIQMLIRLFGSRPKVVDSPARFAGEIGTLEAIHAHLSRSVPPTGTLTIEQSQLEALAKGIASFLDFLQKSQTSVGARA
jgi:hypothetical protein